MFRKLQKYKGKHGNCLVPCSYKEDPQLGIWAKNQRSRRKMAKLTRQRKERLDALGFEWESWGNQYRLAGAYSRWEARYQELVRFHRSNGHCQVPKKDSSLYAWTVRQRHRRYNPHGMMRAITNDEISLLDEIDFEWIPSNSKLWNRKYQALKQYQMQHGNCDVPQTCDTKLYGWLYYQRKQYKICRLSQERIEKLDRIGFSWGRQYLSHIHI